MSRLLPRLPFLKRDRPRSVEAPDASSVADRGAPDLEDLGPPPVLRPAAIFRQLLWDPNELAPVWARPRVTPSPTQDAATIEAPITADPRPAPPPKPTKATRRQRPPKAEASPASPASPAAKPRRPRSASPKSRGSDH